MNDDSTIADLEAEIESLSEAAERCRKTILGARLLWGGAIVVFCAVLLGAFGGSAEALVAAIAAFVGGIGLNGSSRGTLRELDMAIRRLEAQRNAAIDRMNLMPAQTANGTSTRLSQS